MIRRALVAAAALTLALPSSHARADEEPRTILFLGNSFTGTAGGLHLIVRDIAVAAGHPVPDVRALIVGGRDLDFFADNIENIYTQFAPPPGQLTDIVLQGHSTRTTTSHPTDSNRPLFRDAAGRLMDHARGHTTDVRATLFETWARGHGHAFYPSIWPHPNAMQAEVRESYELALDDLTITHGADAARVAPVGQGFRAAGWTTDLYADDRWHADALGGLVGALILYGTTYDADGLDGIDLTSIAAGLGVDAARIPDAVRWAETAMVPSPGVWMIGLVAAIPASARRRRPA